jgi:hypothetical protein
MSQPETPDFMDNNPLDMTVITPTTRPIRSVQGQPQTISPHFSFKTADRNDGKLVLRGNPLRSTILPLGNTRHLAKVLAVGESVAPNVLFNSNKTLGGLDDDVKRNRGKNVAAIFMS